MSSAETPPASSKTIPDVSEERLTEIEPGACAESMLVTTDSFEEFANEMSSSLEKKNILSGISSTINEIQGGIQELDVNSDKKDQSENNAELHRAASEASLQSSDRLSTPDGGSQSAPVEEESVNGDDCLHDPEWMTKKKHIFILSSAGKPIYSRYGNEDKLAGLCGIIQALVSVVHDSNQDTLRCIRAGACSVVFLVRGPLILATACQTRESDTQLILQLTYVFNQIVSVLTLTQLTRIFEQRRNYDLRRLLSGVERLIDHLVNFMEKDAAFLMGAVRCLPLAPTMRDNITGAIISACSKIKDLVFAILMAGNQLITLVRMKKYTLHPSDIHLLFNLVRSSESFKTAESWTPICLPKFDPSGFLHGHVSYLSDDCQACLVLLTVQRDAFHPLSQAKHTITEKLRRTNCLEAINEAVSQSKTLPTTKPLRHIGVPEMRHFIYKCLSTAQLFTSDTPDFPSHKPQKAEDSGSTTSQDNVPSAAGAKIMSNRVGDGKESALKMPDVDYLDNYRQVCSQLHCTARPVNLIYRVNTNNAILAWVSPGFELYVTFDPLVEKNTAIAAVDKLLRWIKKEEDRIFIMKAPTF